MLYALIKMSKWYAQSIESVEESVDWIQTHVDNGDIVLITDSIEYAKDEMGIEDVEIITGD